MGDEELTLILRLRDEASKQVANIRKGVVVAAAAIAAAGFKAGADWDKATKTIVTGTGAAGKQLAQLQKDFQAVARWGPEAATAVADLNTHLGLMGPELQAVAEAALKAGVNTNSFGSFSRQMGLDAAGAVSVLDQLSKVADDTGLEVDDLTRIVSKNAARFQAAGVDVKGLTDIVVNAAYEFGPRGYARGHERDRGRG